MKKYDEFQLHQVTHDSKRRSSSSSTTHESDSETVSISTAKAEEESEETWKKYVKSWGKKIHSFLEDPTYNNGSFIYQLAQGLVILMSTISFLIESTPPYWDKSNTALGDIEIFVIVDFTTDYLTRLLTSGPKWYKWVVFPLNIIDILAIIPFYLELIIKAITGGKPAVSTLAILRVLRLLRVLRILKLVKHTTLFPLVVKAIKNSKSGIALLGFLIMLLLTISSSAMFYAEQTISWFDNSTEIWYYSADNSTSFYQSIPYSFWWCFVTIATVGYGDTYPKSAAGKVVACLTMFCALISLSLPIIMIGNAFNDAIARQRAEKEEAEHRRLGIVEQTVIVKLKRKARHMNHLIKELQEEAYRINRLIVKIEEERIEIVTNKSD